MSDMQYQSKQNKMVTYAFINLICRNDRYIMPLCIIELCYLFLNDIMYVSLDFNSLTKTKSDNLSLYINTIKIYGIEFIMKVFMKINKSVNLLLNLSECKEINIITCKIKIFCVETKRFSVKRIMYFTEFNGRSNVINFYDIHQAINNFNTASFYIAMDVIDIENNGKINKLQLSENIELKREMKRDVNIKWSIKDDLLKRMKIWINTINNESENYDNTWYGPLFDNENWMLTIDKTKGICLQLLMLPQAITFLTIKLTGIIAFDKMSEISMEDKKNLDLICTETKIYSFDLNKQNQQIWLTKFPEIMYLNFIDFVNSINEQISIEFRLEIIEIESNDYMKKTKEIQTIEKDKWHQYNIV